jgi:hypothetical protein
VKEPLPNRPSAHPHSPHAEEAPSAVSKHEGVSRSHRMTLLRASALAVLALPGPLASAERAVPVVIGGACPVGRIIGLDPASVRSGPGREGYQEVDRRLNGQRVHVCGERDSWFAVIYHPSGRAADCGVSAPWPSRKPYGGPCRSGWIDRNVVDIDED